MKFIEISYTGPGVAPLDQGRRFEEFVQLPERDRSGSGQGDPGPVCHYSPDCVRASRTSRRIPFSQRSGSAPLNAMNRATSS